MFKTLRKFISNNIYFIVGILIGLFICNSVLYVDETCDHYTENDEEFKIVDQNPIPPKKFVIPVKNQTKAKHEASTVKKKKLVRPRYYSTELGIRSKLFVGIFTSEERVNTQGIYINKTIGHLVDKIKYFITAQYKVKSKFNLTGLVGFTDTRYKYRPFQIIKYIGDNFGQEYDYYFLADDYTYINIHTLKKAINKISVSMDVYLGTKEIESSYCNLDSGIILSNSVLKALRDHLDWCVINTVSDSHSENIARCVHHSIGLTCQDSVQDQSIGTYKIKHFDLSKHLLDLSQKKEFNEAATIYPVLQKEDFHLLNVYFLRQKLRELKEEINELSDGLTESWPAGHRAGAKPATRFDLPRQNYFNMTHIFFPDDFANVRLHTEAELLDLQNIIREVTAKSEENDKNLQFKQLVNGYRTFDLSRGMDYVLDLEYLDKKSLKTAMKRFEVCKPLGKVEFMPVPYVTENTRVTIFLIIQENEIGDAKVFLDGYSNIMSDKKDKNFLMLILLYQYNTSSKGNDDIFYEIKNFATKMAVKYKNEDTKIAWVSVRIPISDKHLTINDNRALNFAVVDLALKKVGVDNLLLILDPYCNISTDFLNREPK